MYKEYEKCIGNVIVSSHGESMLEYTGILISEYDNTIQLRDATITRVMQSLQKSIFGSEVMTYKRNISVVSINKNYVISCNKVD